MQENQVGLAAHRGEEKTCNSVSVDIVEKIDGRQDSNSDVLLTTTSDETHNLLFKITPFI